MNVPQSAPGPYFAQGHEKSFVTISKYLIIIIVLYYDPFYIFETTRNLSGFWRWKLEFCPEEGNRERTYHSDFDLHPNFFFLVDITNTHTRIYVYSICL